MCFHVVNGYSYFFYFEFPAILNSWNPKHIIFDQIKNTTYPQKKFKSKWDINSNLNVQCLHYALKVLISPYVLLWLWSANFNKNISWHSILYCFVQAFGILISKDLLIWLSNLSECTWCRLFLKRPLNLISTFYYYLWVKPLMVESNY